MGWSRAAAQQLLHVKTAIINGRLNRYTGHHSVPADIARLKVFTGLDLTANDTDSGLWISMARIVLRETPLTDFNLMGLIRRPIQRLSNLSGQIIE
jgi:hypothetical protein